MKNHGLAGSGSWERMCSRAEQACMGTAMPAWAQVRRTCSAVRKAHRSTHLSRTRRSARWARSWSARIRGKRLHAGRVGAGWVQRRALVHARGPRSLLEHRHALAPAIHPLAQASAGRPIKDNTHCQCQHTGPIAQLAHQAGCFPRDNRCLRCMGKQGAVSTTHAIKSVQAVCDRLDTAWLLMLLRVCLQAARTGWQAGRQGLLGASQISRQEPGMLAGSRWKVDGVLVCCRSAGLERCNEVCA